MKDLENNFKTIKDSELSTINGGFNPFKAFGIFITVYDAAKDAAEGFAEGLVEP